MIFQRGSCNPNRGALTRSPIAEWDFIKDLTGCKVYDGQTSPSQSDLREKGYDVVRRLAMAELS